LHYTALQSKYFVFRLRSYAFDQNPLDLIGFLVVGLCICPLIVVVIYRTRFPPVKGQRQNDITRCSLDSQLHEMSGISDFGSDNLHPLLHVVSMTV
jgi:hypothetical protein